MNPADLDRVADEAGGALLAQQYVDAARAGDATPDVGWLFFVELATRTKVGWKGPAARSFVVELCKRAAEGR